MTVERLPYLVVTRGIPGCGKSTWARKVQAAAPEGQVKLVNMDELRNMLDQGVWSRENEDFMQALQAKIVTEAVTAGHDVIVHNTHMFSKVPNTLKRVTAGLCTPVVAEFDTPTRICIERDAAREGRARVGEEVIYRMEREKSKGRKGFKGDWTFYDYGRVEVLLSEPFTVPPCVTYTPDETLPTACIVDLDGTLAKHNGRNPYDGSRCEEDLWDELVWDAVSKYDAVVFLSGREDKWREHTRRWLNGNLDTAPAEGMLLMRQAGDMRSDSIVKEEIFWSDIAPKYNVKLVLDDRNSVVKMWRRLGLTCWQVAEGDF